VATDSPRRAERRVYADDVDLAEGAAQFVAEALGEAIAVDGRGVLALSGGSTPRGLYQRLAGEPWRRRIAWVHVHVIWGDERAVPPDHPQSNYRMTREALLDHVPVLPGNVHRIPGELEPAVAAIVYERTLRALLGTAGASLTPAHGPDVTLLGLGADGHTASLFPGRPPVHERGRWVVADEIDGHGTWRITLTPLCLNTSATAAFVVAGAAKADVVRRVIEGVVAPDVLPAQAITPRRRLVWLLDAGAAAGLAGPDRLA
jgi:6-phosphogluconolactonase